MGDMHERTLNAMFLCGQIEAACGNYKAGMGLLNEALAGHRKLFGEAHAKTQDTHGAIKQLQDVRAAHKRDEARREHSGTSAAATRTAGVGVVQGLVGRTDLNGTEVDVYGWDEATQRYTVRELAAASGGTKKRTFKLRAENLLLSQGAVVIVVGLVSSPDLNGQRGTVQSFDAERGRYQVTLQTQARHVWTPSVPLRRAPIPHVQTICGGVTDRCWARRSLGVKPSNCRVEKSRSAAAVVHPKAGYLLTKAGSGGDCDELRRLLEPGTDTCFPNAAVQTKDPKSGQVTSTTVLFETIKAGQKRAAKLLLERGADPNQPSTAPGGSAWTPLMWVASVPSYAFWIRLLCEHGANINAIKDDPVATVLHTACSMGYEAACVSLLEHGADPRLVAPGHGISALMVAACEGHLGIVKLTPGLWEPTVIPQSGGGEGNWGLVTTQNMETGPRAVIHTASTHNNTCDTRRVCYCRLLLRAGADMDAIGSHVTGGTTALHGAVARGQVACAKALVQAGCDTTAVDTRGRTARVFAMRSGNQAMLQAFPDAS